ncbi:unnamed protein product [Brassicogethes aeneus]|uniref:Autophagy-related protein 9 n=1 Tax=Brassicogethes aeneus TaxID=1431903 RepID=A0A9P0B9M0_BRAAE|nr:unnamed protein product [Brassicogethes aeneus]
MKNYQSLSDVEYDEGSSNHVLFQAEPKRSRWNHIIDLDSFFARTYSYHQNHGFLCMLLQEMFELNQFAFVVALSAYLAHGVNYEKLFHRGATKTTMSEVILPLSECVGNFSWITWIVLLIAMAVFAFKFIKGVYKIVKFWDIKQFYNIALGIRDKELDNITWNEVQVKIKVAQLQHQMCIHKRELTELDIYHRILRQKNYILALVNKRILPPRINIPLVGEEVYWTKTLCYNMEWLLFRSPWSPFENPFNLREEYKKVSLRQELATQLGRHVLYLAFVNLIFAPLILLWQILYAFFYYADLFRRDPAKVGLRNWSLYALLYLRHFNELDHEVAERLTKAHKAATRYVSAFSSPLTTLIASHVSFISGSIMAVFIVLTLYDEDVLSVEHVITLISGLGVIVAICRAMQPDENVSWCPESLLSAVVLHTHYLPADWQGHAHTKRIRKQFEQLFQYRVVGLVEELLSPIVTPYILWRCIYPKSLDIIDFFRNFTVTVVGVGDVCSFAQMDIKRHGNPDWHNEQDVSDVNQYSQAEDGKVELSLVHFKMTNPAWVPPVSAMEFVSDVEQYNVSNSMLNFPAGKSAQDPRRSVRLSEGLEDPNAFQYESMGQSVMYLHGVNKQKSTLSFAEEDTPLLQQD